jgi:hypothetical protein
MAASLEPVVEQPIVVLVERLGHEQADFGFEPGLAERREVLAGVAVEHELIRHHLIGVTGEMLLLGHAVLRHGDREVGRGEDLVEDLVADVLAVVQHRKAPSSVWSSEFPWRGSETVRPRVYRRPSAAVNARRPPALIRAG